MIGEPFGGNEQRSESQHVGPQLMPENGTPARFTERSSWAREWLMFEKSWLAKLTATY
jgi:hypothetical protein